jgi:DNA phosphorothioation-dependent restriction protein DptH
MTFHDLHNELLNSELEAQLHPYLVTTIQQRGAGHCMRLTDLDQQLMEQLAKSIRRDLPDAQVYILSNFRPDEHSELYITSTKLVELRNPGEDGNQRSPLLVMIPANLRTSAEDSFSVATFEELNVSNVYQRLVDNLRLFRTCREHHYI